jgi:hypothetical protein
MYPPIDQHPDLESQPLNQDFQAPMTNFPANAEFNQHRHAASSLPPSNGFTAQSRRAQRSMGSSIRSSDKAPSRSITSRKPKFQRRLSTQNVLPHIPDTAQNTRSKLGVAKSQSKTLSFECTTNVNVSKAHTIKFQEPIALVQESIKPFSPFSQRKATDLINQMEQLVNQLGQLAIEEEKYGNTSSDVDDVTQPSTAASSQASISNSALVDSESETDNTSVSSTPRELNAQSHAPISINDNQQGAVHARCMQCGIKSLYFCTREDCRYSTHSLPEWKRHEKSQKHSQQERFMCLECPVSPPAVDMNGDSICEFCRVSSPMMGANLTAPTSNVNLLKNLVQHTEERIVSLLIFAVILGWSM